VAIESALDIARGVLDARDAQTMRALRARLDALMSSQEAWGLTRKNALSLLRTISEGLKPSTDQPIGAVSAEEMLITRGHPALELLDRLIDALSDLDRGKCDPSLKPSTHQANASLTTKQRKWDQVLLDDVLIVQRVRGYKKRSKAERFLAGQLRKEGKTRRSKPYTAGMLKRLRDDYKKMK
jgi:hypothetical protein